MSKAADQNPTAGRCPICKRASAAQYRPFCSKRCADIDLSRWLSGSYVIAGEAASDDGDEDGMPLAGLTVPNRDDVD